MPMRCVACHPGAYSTCAFGWTARCGWGTRTGFSLTGCGLAASSRLSLAMKLRSIEVKRSDATGLIF